MASLLIQGFHGLTKLDFDLYQPKCWANNMHNLGRMKTKERIVTLARAVAARVDEGRLVLESSSEIPSVWNGRQVRDQWAYLLRTPDARKMLLPMFAQEMDLATRVKDPAEHHRHILLCVRIDHEVLEIGLRLNEHATVDLGNLLALGKTAEDEFSALLKALPEGVTLGDSDDDEPITLEAVLAAARSARAGDAEWLMIARRYTPDEAVELGGSLTEHIVQIAEAMTPLYDFIEWRPDNDHVDVESALSEVEKTRAARHAAEAAAQTAAAEAREARQEAARVRTSAKVAAEQAWRAMTAKKRRESVSASPKAQRPAQAAPKPAPKPEPRAKEAVTDLEPGQMVRMLRGLLGGKEGTITSAESEGYYKVKVGSLEVSVAATDLERVE